MEQKIKAKVALGLPLSAKEEANYILLIASKEEYLRYMNNKKNK